MGTSLRARTWRVCFWAGLLWCLPGAAFAASAMRIECAYADPAPAFASVTAAWRSLVRSDSASKSPEPAKPRELTDCGPFKGKSSVLVGPGDVIVVANEDDYVRLSDAANDDGAVVEKRPRLFLDGFDLGAQSKLVSEVRGNGLVALRFRVGARRQGAEQFWSTIYRNHGLLSPVASRAGFGWRTAPEFDGPPRENVVLMVQVTGLPALVAATVLMAFLVFSFVWALRNSDIFRIQPLDQVWRDARKLRKDVYRHVFSKRTKVPPDFVARKTELMEAFARCGLKDFTWPAPQDVVRCFGDCTSSALADLKSGTIPTDDAARQRVLVGLGISQAPWKLPRLPYSLGTVQPGVWLTFAVTAAVYLWLVFGEFPALDGSVLGLVGISVVTGGCSRILDNQIDASPRPSQGFLFDLLTDNDDRQQAHRYQALVVTVLLLVVGVVYIVQSLLYPNFDPTWLGLAAISGVGQVAGKNISEVPDPSSKVVVAPQPVGGAGAGAPQAPAPAPQQAPATLHAPAYGRAFQGSTFP